MLFSNLFEKGTGERKYVTMIDIVMVGYG